MRARHPEWYQSDTDASKVKGNKSSSSSGPVVWPVPDVIAGKYSFTYNPDTKTGHRGIDIPGGINGGQQVVSAFNGVVVRTEKLTNSYGNFVVVKSVIDNKEIFVYYAHMASFQVKVGDQLDPGSQIGIVGSTGKSTGPHLHFEIRLDNNYDKQINPMNYLGGY